MYKLNQNSTSIRRLSDGASIPKDPANTDYTNYLKWLAAGNTPEPADVPTAEEVAALAAKQSIDVAIGADTTLAQLKAMTNAEFDAWWLANVTTAALAIQVLKRLAKLVIRRLL